MTMRRNVARNFHESRLPPLGKSFVHLLDPDAEPQASHVVKRNSSFSGFIPYALQELAGDYRHEYGTKPEANCATADVEPRCRTPSPRACPIVDIMTPSPRAYPSPVSFEASPSRFGGLELCPPPRAAAMSNFSGSTWDSVQDEEFEVDGICVVDIPFASSFDRDGAGFRNYSAYYPGSPLASNTESWNNARSLSTMLVNQPTHQTESGAELRMAPVVHPWAGSAQGGSALSQVVLEAASDLYMPAVESDALRVQPALQARPPSSRQNKAKVNFDTWANTDQKRQSKAQIVEEPRMGANSDLPTTTLMIRNLPDHVTQPVLLSELNQCGFKDAYDFVYLPQSFHTNANSGFAFINFIDPLEAAALIGSWHRQRRFGVTGGKSPLNIAPAALQGLEANLRKWVTPRLRRIKNPNLRPFIVEDGAKRLRKLTEDYAPASTVPQGLQQGQLAN